MWTHGWTERRTDGRASSFTDSRVPKHIKRFIGPQKRFTRLFSFFFFSCCSHLKQCGFPQIRTQRFYTGFMQFCFRGNVRDLCSPYIPFCYLYRSIQYGSSSMLLNTLRSDLQPVETYLEYFLCHHSDYSWNTAIVLNCARDQTSFRSMECFSCERIAVNGVVIGVKRGHAEERDYSYSVHCDLQHMCSIMFPLSNSRHI